MELLCHILKQFFTIKSGQSNDQSNYQWLTLLAAIAFLLIIIKVVFYPLTPFYPTRDQKSVIYAGELCEAIKSYINDIGDLPDCDSRLSKELSGENPQHKAFYEIDNYPERINISHEFIDGYGKPFKVEIARENICVYFSNGTLAYSEPAKSNPPRQP